MGIVSSDHQHLVSPLILAHHRHISNYNSCDAYYTNGSCIFKSVCLERGGYPVTGYCAGPYEVECCLETPPTLTEDPTTTITTETASPPPSGCGITNEELQVALLSAINAADFSTTWDLQTDSITHAINNVDISVIAFFTPDCNNTNDYDESQQGSPSMAYANVLISRDFPNGRVSSFDPDTMSVEGVQWRWWDYPRWEATNEQEWTAPPSGDWFGEVVEGLEGIIDDESR